MPYINKTVVYLWVADKSIVPPLYSPLFNFLKWFAFICPCWIVEVFYEQTHLFCPLIVGHKPNNLLLIACKFPQPKHRILLKGEPHCLEYVSSPTNAL